jgi:phosphonate transport system substrate-binding protein
MSLIADLTRKLQVFTFSLCLVFSASFGLSAQAEEPSAQGKEPSAQGKEPLVQNEHYSFGIVPQQSPSKLAKQWGPILRYLTKKTGIQLRFATARNIPIFEQRLANGEYDFAYMNPYHYTTFHKAPGYKAFAKQKDKHIKGILVVPKNSPYKTPNELAGLTLAFPSPAAFAASILPRAYLTKNNIAFTPKYVASHDSVYLSVAKGLYPAGGGIERTFKSITPDVQARLKILWRTQPYTPHAFAAHPRVPKSVVNTLSAAMIALGEDPVAKKLLASIRFIGIEPAKDADWNDVRSIGLPLLDELINN